MKLTTTKISIPVLMIMLFQSGYGIDDWFDQALGLAAKGQTMQAVRLIVENNPSSVTMTDEAKRDFVNELETLIRSTIDGFVPRGYDVAGPRELFKIDAMIDMLALQDVTADTVKNSFTNTIVDTFYANLGWLGRNADVAKEVSDVTTAWANSAVPQQEDANYSDFVGTGDTPADGTVRKFIEVVTLLNPDSEDPAIDEQGKTALNSLLGHGFLSKLEATETFNWKTIRRAFDLGQDDVSTVIEELTDEAINIHAKAFDVERNVWDHSEVPALEEGDVIPAALLGQEGDPADGTIRKFLEDSTAPEPDWEGIWDTLIHNGTYHIDGLTIGGKTATLAKIQEAAAAGEEPATKERAIYNILTKRANEVRKGDSVVDWLISDLDFMSKNIPDAGENRGEVLRSKLYNDSAEWIAKGDYDDSDELSYFLNLFGYWKIEGNHDVPDVKEEFLNAILNDVNTKVDEARGETPVAEWVDAHPEEARAIVNNSVYSKFGTTYEDLLRHTAEDPAADLPRQTTLVNDMIKATNEAETKAAAEKVVETLDGNASSTVAQAVKDIKQVVS